jgi:hypothetical protein
MAEKTPEKKIRVMALRAVRAAEGRSLVLEDVSTGELERLDDVDTIVAAVGGVAQDALSHALRGRVPDLRMVGDCVAPRTALEAVYEATRSAASCERTPRPRRGSWAPRM